MLRATLAVTAALELIDSRIVDWRIGLADTIADNASSAGFVLGAARVKPRETSICATFTGHAVAKRRRGGHGPLGRGPR